MESPDYNRGDKFTMNTQNLTATEMQSSRRHRAICGLSCISIMLLSFAVVLGSGSDFGGWVDIHLRYVLPVVCLLLAVCSLIRRERLVWPMIGFVLLAFYIGLHLIPNP